MEDDRTCLSGMNSRFNTLMLITLRVFVIIMLEYSMIATQCVQVQATRSHIG